MTDTAIVTGGSSGIGRATCVALAEEGYNVVVADVRKDPREGGPRTHETLKSDGHAARFWETDVRDWEQVQEVVAKAVEWYGSVDVLVNNAGVAEKGGIEDTAIEDAHRIFRVNVEGTYHGMKAVVPRMKEQGSGSIVNVASVAGKHGSAGHVDYCGSKFAVIGMTKALADELADTDITVNAVCPGRTKTAMTDFEGVPPGTVAETILDVVDAGYTGRAVDV